MGAWSRSRFERPRMTQEVIEQLASRLPVQDPYFTLRLGTQARQDSASELERLEAALYDPAFGWNVPLSHVRAGVPLPDLPWPAPMLRAHRSLSNPNQRDDAIVFVEALN